VAGVTEVGRLMIRLLGDNSAYLHALNSAITSTQTWASRVELIFKGFVQPLAALGAGGVAAFAGFDQALARTGSLSQVTEEQLARMGQRALDLSTQLPISAAQLSAAFYNLIRSGMTAEQAIGALDRVARLSVATNTDLDRTVVLVSTTMRNMGLNAGSTTLQMENLNRVTDLMTRASQLAIGSTQHLGQAITRQAADVAQFYNISLESLVATLTAYAERGVEGRAAGTAFARVMRFLAQAAVKNEEAFKRLEIEVFDSNRQLRDVTDIADDLSAAMNRLNPRSRAVALHMLGFGANTQGAIMPLLQMNQRVREIRGQLQGFGGTTDDVSNRVMLSFNSQMTILKNTVQALGIEIGQWLAPAILAVNKGIRAAINWWRNLDTETRFIIKSTLLIVAALTLIGPALAMLKIAFYPIFNSLREGLILAELGMYSFFGKIPGWGGTLLLLLIPLKGLWAVIRMILSPLKLVWMVLVPLFGVLRAVGGIIAAPLMMVFSLLGSLGTALYQSLSFFWRWAGVLIWTVPDIGRLFLLMSYNAIQALGVFLRFFNPLTIFGILFSIGGSAIYRLGRALLMVLSPLKLLGSMLSIIYGALRALVLVILSPWFLLLMLIGFVVASVAVLIQKLGGFQATWEKVKEWAAMAWEWIMNRIEAFIEWMYPIFMALGSFFRMVWEGIVAVVEAVWGFIIGVVRAAVNWINTEIESLGITIPTTWEEIQTAVVVSIVAMEFFFRNFGKFMEFLWIGALLGLITFANQIEFFFTGRISTILQWFSDNWRDIFRDMWNFTYTIFSNLGSNIANVMRNLPGLIRGSVRWDEIWTPLTEGFERRTRELVLPERAPGLLEEQLRRMYAAAGGALQGEWEEFRDRKLEDFRRRPSLIPAQRIQEEARRTSAGLEDDLFKPINNEIKKFDAVLVASAEAMFRVTDFIDRMSSDEGPVPGRGGRGGRGGGPELPPRGAWPRAGNADAGVRLERQTDLLQQIRDALVESGRRPRVEIDEADLG
jgi:TP901 family phage tail tape measure protein